MTCGLAAVAEDTWVGCTVGASHGGSAGLCKREASDCIRDKRRGSAAADAVVVVVIGISRNA